MIGLYDERWYERGPGKYAEFLQNNGITDLYMLVWRRGEQRYKDEDMSDLVSNLHDRGIRAHASINTFKSVEGFPIFEDPLRPDAPTWKQFADVNDPSFQTFIENKVTQLSRIFDGVNLDYVRTLDTDDRCPDSIANTIKRIYTQVKNVYPNCIVSCCTHPWKVPGSTPFNNGSDPIRWANEGYMDVILGMNYGNQSGGEIGDDPDMGLIRKAQSMTSAPVVPIVSCYQRKLIDGVMTSVPSDRWDQIPGKVVFDDYVIYTGWLFEGMPNE